MSTGGFSFGGDMNGDIVQGDQYKGNITKIEGDMHGNITNTYNEAGEKFYETLLNTICDAGDAQGIQYDEAEVSTVINELNELSKGDAPTEEVVETAKGKWTSLLEKFGPSVAQIALAGIQAFPVAGPIASMVMKVLEIASQPKV